MWPRRFAVAVGLGGVYGLLALEAVSPLAIVLLIWVIVILATAWRIPPRPAEMAASASGLILGFALLWAVVLRQQLATCKPPSCAAADLMTNLLYVAAFLVPVIGLAAALIGLRFRMSRHRL
ncbi:MAG TPA: hypothetical protein VGE99_05330 [Candidatus Dormibacteraeota bacterium]